MTVSVLRSENITGIESVPISILQNRFGQSQEILDKVTVPVGSLDEAGDRILFGPIPSDAIISDIQVANTVIDSGGVITFDLGLAYSGDGDGQALLPSGTLIDADCIASNILTLSGANNQWTSIRFENIALSTVVDPAYSLCELSSTPGGFLYLVLTVVTPADTAVEGTILFRTNLIK